MKCAMLVDLSIRCSKMGRVKSSSGWHAWKLLNSTCGDASEWHDINKTLMHHAWRYVKGSCQKNIFGKLPIWPSNQKWYILYDMPRAMQLDASWLVTWHGWITAEHGSMTCYAKYRYLETDDPPKKFGLHWGLMTYDVRTDTIDDHRLFCPDCLMMFAWPMVVAQLGEVPSAGGIIIIWTTCMHT